MSMSNQGAVQSCVKYLRGALGSACVVASALGCGNAENNASEDVALAQQPVINGAIVTPWPSGTPAYTRAIVNAGCSATLVEPDWVLTAKHCEIPVGATVTSVRPSGNVSSSVDRVVGPPNTREDGYLLHLDIPINDAPKVPLCERFSHAHAGRSAHARYLSARGSRDRWRRATSR